MFLFFKRSLSKCSNPVAFSPIVFISAIISLMLVLIVKLSQISLKPAGEILLPDIISFSKDEGFC